MKNKSVVRSDQKPNLEQLLQMYEKLDGQVKEIRSQFKRGVLTSRHVQGLIEHRNPFAKKPDGKWKTWKTIKLGTGLNIADDFRKALKAGGYRISKWANDILNRPALITSQTEKELELVIVSVAELGFKNGAIRQDVYQIAKELGLELCPAEVGPQLRIQYKDQPYGEWLRIAMEPITDSFGNLSVFSVEHDDDGQWLHSSYGHPDDFWSDSNQWVFVCRPSTRA